MFCVNFIKKLKNIIMKKNKAALVTGGAKRIGREMVLMLAAKGFDVAVTYNHSKKEAQQLADKIKAEFKVDCEIFHCDLKSPQDAQNMIAQVIKKFPNLSLLINNASIFNQSKFLTAPQEELTDNLNIHFISPLILSQKFASHVLSSKIKDAQIINMLDKNIVRFDTSYFYYLLSKKNLAELTKMLALELAPQIRVNGIAPGFILNSVNDQNPSQEFVDKIIKKIPLQKKGDVKNICQTLEFLLENDFVSGMVIFVDGAASLNHAG